MIIMTCRGLNLFSQRSCQTTICYLWGWLTWLRSIFIKQIIDLINILSIMLDTVSMKSFSVVLHAELQLNFPNLKKNSGEFAISCWVILFWNRFWPTSSCFAVSFKGKIFVFCLGSKIFLSTTHSRAIYRGCLIFSLSLAEVPLFLLEIRYQ